MVLLWANAALAQYAPYKVTTTAPSFVSLANSDWGTSGSLTDLTGRVFLPVALDTVLPVSTSGWSTTTIGPAETYDCNQTDIQSAIDAATDGTIIDLATNCTTITITSMGGGQGGVTAWSIPNDVDGLLIDGTGVSIVRTPSTEPETQYAGSSTYNGYNDVLFGVSNGASLTPITSWTWNSGFTKGTQVIGVSTSLSNVYENDIVQLTVSDWNESQMDYRVWYRVLCAQWSDSTQHGSDCSGVTADNSVKIDQGLPIDFSTPGVYQIGNFSGYTLSHIERNGGGTVTDNVPENIGFKGFTVTHTYPYAVDDSSPVFNWFRCFECWTEGLTLNAWGSTHNRMLAYAHRVLELSNDREGQLWRDRCVASVTAISADTPAQVTIASTSIGNVCDSTRWNGGSGTEPAIWFGPGFSESCTNETLASGLFQYSCTSLDCDASDGQVTVSIKHMEDGSNVDGTGCADSSPSGYIANLNQYGIASTYALTGSSDIQTINNSFHNVRVGVIWQGTNLGVAAYNYFLTDSDTHCSRFLFIHGSAEPASLWEGNDGDCGYVPYASAAQGHGLGPYLTFYKNRGQTRTSNAALGDQCNGGGLCLEHESQAGYSTDESNYIGNLWTNITGAAIDDCDNNDVPNDSTPGNGCESPYQTYGLYWARNVVTEETLAEADDFETAANNTTTSKSDYQEGDLLDTAPAGWSSTVYPTSILYRDGELPRSWMCTQSIGGANGLIPQIGAEFDDVSGTLTKLPAQIRYESGTCTAP